jgi:glyoxylase-like metal-dependent hydrolase (beta-lactamase superfamily II)
VSWDELGPGCYRRRYASFDLNVGVVAGGAGTLLIDSRASGGEADELRADLRALGTDEPRWVVNTHGHFDHCLGNARFRGSELWGHASVPGAMAGFNRETIAAWYPEWGAIAEDPLEVVPPSHLVTAPEVLDLGDRLVEVAYLGPGHTEGDLVVCVPDAGVVFAGDLVERGSPPRFGPDCYPMSWPDTADGLLVRVPAGARVVPGHGDVLDRAAVERQAAEIRQVAAEIRALYDAGVPLADAIEQGTWPYPRERLAAAVRRGFWQLDAPSGLFNRIG